MSENVRLADNLFLKVQAFTEQGDQLMQAENFTQAIKEYQKAWSLLPEPKQLWDVSTWIKVAQAEALLMLKDYAAAREKLMQGIICKDAVHNPLVHLLLGIANYETGDMDSAKKELQLAYDLEGESIFADEDDKYLQLLKESID